MSELRKLQAFESALPAPRLYLISDEQTDIAFLEGRLTTLGYDIVGNGIINSDYIPDFRAIPDFVLCAVDTMTRQVETIISAIKTACAPKEICLVGLLGKQKSNPSHIFDTVLFQPAHPVQVHHRMNALKRLRRMEKALTLRRETLAADFSVNCPSGEDLLGVPFRILFVGTASPEFMSVLNALQEKNVEVLAAFTSFTAFDYLHERDFDAVVLNATESLEPALSVSETMRRNPRLFHIPTLVMAKEGHADVGEIAIKKGARDVFFTGASKYEICGRILELANFFRIHGFLKNELSKIDNRACLDNPTGLYNRDFLHAHLRRVAGQYEQIGEGLALLMLRVRPKATDAVDPRHITDAINKMGSMLKSLVRAEDITARISGDIFVVAFPGQSQAMAQIAGKRVKDIIEQAVFKTDHSGAPLTLEAELLFSAKMAHENSDHFINRTEAEILGEPTEKLVAY